MALGARRAHVLQMVFSYAGLLVSAGAVIGVGTSIAAGRLIASQLFEVRPTDPATYTVVASLLLATAIAACAIPAFRAMRVDPLVALRAE